MNNPRYFQVITDGCLEGMKAGQIFTQLNTILFEGLEELISNGDVVEVSGNGD